MNKIFQFLLIAYLAVSFSHNTDERSDIISKELPLEQSSHEAVTNINQDRKDNILRSYDWKDAFDDTDKLNLPQHLLVN